MDSQIKVAFRYVIDYLDNLMQETPGRELADVSNYLEAMLEKESKLKGGE